MNESQLSIITTSLVKHPLVWTVIGISCFAYFLLMNHGLGALDRWFMPNHIGELLTLDSIWRLWSPTFVHYTVLHLLTNLYLWWLFASKIERHSKVGLLVLCTIAAAFSNLLQWSITGPNFGGLSGVTYALLSYLWISARYAGKKYYAIDSQLAMLLLILIPVAATGVFGKFANFAHIGGLVSGALVAGMNIYKYKR